MSINTRQKHKIIVYICFIIAFLFFCAPLLWVLSMSLQENGSSEHASLLPSHITFENYKHALQYSLFAKYFYNGLKIAGLSGIISLVICTPGAYAFSRFKFRFKQAILLIILMFQMISGMVTLIPLYRYYQKLGLIDTHTGLIIAYVSGAIAFSTWLLKGTFDSIPIDLDDASRIDGCSRWQSFVKIVMPLAIPGMSAAFILNVIGGWSNFMVPFLLIKTPSKQPIAVGIMQFVGAAGSLTPELLAAGATLALVPAVVIFLLLQKYIINSIGGAVKG